MCFSIGLPNNKCQQLEDFFVASTIFTFYSIHIFVDIIQFFNLFFIVYVHI